MQAQRAPYDSEKALRRELALRAVTLREARCAARDLRACFDRVFDLRSGVGEDHAGRDEAAAESLASRTQRAAESRCDAGQGEACWMAGRLARGFVEHPTPEDYARQLPWVEKACKLDREQCWSFGYVAEPVVGGMAVDNPAML